MAHIKPATASSSTTTAPTASAHSVGVSGASGTVHALSSAPLPDDASCSMREAPNDGMARATMAEPMFPAAVELHRVATALRSVGCERLISSAALGAELLADQASLGLLDQLGPPAVGLGWAPFLPALPLAARP